MIFISEMWILATKLLHFLLHKLYRLGFQCLPFKGATCFKRKIKLEYLLTFAVWHPYYQSKAKKKLFGCPPPPAPNFWKPKKVFTVQKYTASNFQNSQFFFFENFDL